jgi:PKD repeat protein
VDGVVMGAGSHASLAPGETSTGNVRLSWTPASPGIHRVRFEADVDGQVQELLETNNAVEVEAKVGPLPDLLVDDITLAAPPVSGIADVATARLRNVGPAASAAFNVKWFVDGVQVGYGRHAPLASGATSTDNVQFTWTPASAGMHTLRFEADVDGEIVEVEETNNAFQRSFEVARNPVEVSFSPAGPLARNADGWYAPNPVSVQVTLTCPVNGPNCVAPFRLLGESADGARLYAYGTDNGPTVDIQCTVAGEGSEFSHHGFGGACVTLNSGVVELTPGASRSVRFLVWIQPSPASTLEASASWGSWSGRASPLLIPQAAVHPVVFIHGILGAMPPDDKLVTNQVDAHQTFDPFIGSYEPLLNNLQKMGYEWDRSLFGLAYDWRQSNTLSGGFLGEELAARVIPRSQAAAVPYTLKETKGKADLVVHSMGGLVSRAYIEGKALDPDPPHAPIPYADNVHKVVFIASPHKGFPFNYRTREGMTWRDYLYAAPPLSGGIFGTMTMVMDGILWPGLVEKKFVPSDLELDRDCIWVPLVGQDPPGLVPYQLFFYRIRNGQAGYFQCTTQDITPWAKDPVRGARSLFEMLPTDDSPVYLTNLNGVPAGRPASFPWGHDPNTFLHDLNADAHLLVSRLGDPAIADNLYVVYGSGAPETDAYFEVEPPGLKDWQFGRVNQLFDFPDPTLHETDLGDDLIPAHSARMDGVLALPPGQVRMIDASPAGGHIDGGARHVPIAYHRQTQSTWVPLFLTGTTFPVATPYTAPIVQGDNLLAVISACPINLLVIDPQGRKLGFDPATGQVVREIPNAVYTQPGVEPQMILIGQALPGDYQFTATGYDTGAYNMRVVRVGPQGPVPLAQFDGETTAGQQHQHGFGLDPNTPPGAVPDRYIVKPGQTLAIGGPGVLGNDIELDSQPMTASLVSGPAHGGLTLDPDGSFSYAPDPTFPGADSFVYRASDGLVDSNQATVSLSVRPPEVQVSPDQAANEGQVVAFSGSFDDDYPPADHTLAWDFGDGTGTTGTLAPSHAFADNGVYTVTLRVTSPAGLTGSASLRVTVMNVSPAVGAGPDRAAPQGQPIVFAGSFVDPGAGDTHTIVWDFGDATGGEGTLTPTHAYAVPGSYVARLVVRDDDGGEGSDTLNVSITNVPPSVNAGPDVTVGPNEDVRFHGSFSDPGILDTHTLSWDFGDGSAASDTLEPVHRYTAFGVYTVTLTVTDNHGGVGRDTLIVRVVCPYVFVERFDPYGQDKDPAGWTDYAIEKGLGRPVVREGFRTALDPSGVVYRGAEERVSEYHTQAARAWRDYEWTGRFRLPDSHQPGLGLLVYSDVAAGRFYQLSYDWRHKRDGFRAVEGEKGTLKGRTASGFVPDPGVWHRFRVRAESAVGETRLRARFWRDGAGEPAGWAIDARDDRSPTDHGGIGLMSLTDGVAFDELRVEALSDASGISGDRDADAVCDGRDNCPATPNTGQADSDGDGSGDACDACTAAFERQELCLDEGFDPRNDLSDHVVQLIGHARHLPPDGSCGSAGAYRLGRQDGLVIELPSLPGRARYRLQLQVRARHAGDALEVELLGRTLVIPITGHPTGKDWEWTGPVAVELPGGAHFATVRARGNAPVDIEVLRLEEVCAEDRAAQKE